jgi:uncharacterized protein
VSRYSPFFVFLLRLTFVLHVPFAIVIWHFARQSFSITWALGITVASCAIGLSLAFGRIRGGLYDAPRSVWMTEGVDAPYYVHWCACVFALGPTLLILLGSPVLCWARGLAFAIPSLWVVWLYATGLVLAAWGVLIRRRLFRIHRLEIPIVDLPHGFDGYRIAHLSDLHIGAMTPVRRAVRWVSAANRERVDLAVVTGDMVTNGVAFHNDIAAVLGALEAPDGAFVSMGNHDYFGDGEPLLTLLREAGLTVLRNQGVRIRRSDTSVYLAGIDDTYTKRADLTATLAQRTPGEIAVLLAHDPSLFSAAALRDVDLMLSGHTHAGQVAVPFVGRWLSLSHLAHRFHTGVYRRGNSTLYVHPGLGTTGPPIRLGTSPTVAILTLRRAP